MGEAIVLYRGRGGSVDPELLKPQAITSNGTYEAPVTGNYVVYAVGGGGGGGGGCRNSWNSSQVFYGAGGSRGALNTKTIHLNQGDKVTMTLGSGGSGGTNNTGVWSNSSQGSSGSAGGTTTFGSYVSASGGVGGSYSWHYHRLDSKISYIRWMWNGQSFSSDYLYHTKIRIQDDVVGYWWVSWMNNTVCFPEAYILNTTVYNLNSPLWGRMTGARTPNDSGYFKSYGERISTFNWSHLSLFGPSMINEVTLSSSNYQYYNIGSNVYFGTVRELERMAQATVDYYTSIKYGRWNSARAYDLKFFCESSTEAYNMIRDIVRNSGNSSAQIRYSECNRNRYGSYDWNFFFGFANVPYTPTYFWNNTIQNSSTHCYTSIQSGSLWYQNNNTVSTSGTRIYRGDGGSSGQPGNAGYLLIIPPSTST